MALFNKKRGPVCLQCKAATAAALGGSVHADYQRGREKVVVTAGSPDVAEGIEQRRECVTTITIAGGAPAIARDQAFDRQICGGSENACVCIVSGHLDFPSK